MSPLATEKSFFYSIRDSLLATHADQVAVVHGEKLIGIYSTMEEAYTEAVKSVGLVSLLIKKIGEVEQEVSIPALAIGVLNANNTHPIDR